MTATAQLQQVSKKIVPPAGEWDATNIADRLEELAAEARLIAAAAAGLGALQLSSEIYGPIIFDRAIGLAGLILELRDNISGDTNDKL